MRTQNKNNIWNPMSSFGGYLVPTEHGHFGPFWEVAKIALLNPSFEMLSNISLGTYTVLIQMNKWANLKTGLYTFSKTISVVGS